MRRFRWWFLAALPAVFALGIAAFVFLRAQRSLDRAGVAVAGEGRFPFEMRAIGRMENPGFEWIASPAAYTAGAFYRGNLYVSGPSGLFVYGAAQAVGDGATTLLKTYRVGLDLPAAALGAMAVGRLRGASEPELLIATAGEGILVFSASGAADGGGSFRQILPADAEAREVTALLPLATGDLLVGTRKRGLLVYRGTGGSQQLETWHPQLAGLAVTALAADASGFWVGTRDHGVRHCHAGQIDSFDAGGDGSGGALPDAQVDAIAAHGDRVFVGTPLGVEEFDDGWPSRTLARNFFAHALDADEKGLTVGSMDEGVERVSLEGNRHPGLAVAGSEDLIGGEAEQFLKDDSDNTLFAVMRDGVRERQTGGAWIPLMRDAGAATLSDGNVSALAFGPDGRLWVGYFDHGLDVLSVKGERIEHREDDRLFCINRIVLDPRRQTMVVATANGLVLFDAQGKPRQSMTRRDGLIADHVTDIAFAGESMVLATPAGLTFVDADGARSLYAFEGLVNNHVYALGVQDKTLLAGTLGGVSELEQESVRRNLTVSNSGLKHNWVTAIVPMGDGSWMAGTYGAGVMRLGADGRFTAMEGATRAMDVNPNAMLQTDAHVFAGTLGQGLWVWSRAAGRWRQITAGLPSENVTAIAARDGRVYVGTDNGLVRIAERLLDEAGAQ
jgi:ligand-binding sensor domain-containing protein